MHNLVSKILKSENFILELISLLWSFIFHFRYNGKLIKFINFNFKNEGELEIKNGRLFLGFLSNRVGLNPNIKGVLRIYKRGKMSINGFTRIARGCKIYVPGNLEIGEGTYINPNVLIFARSKVIIGKNCAISWDCQILDDDFHQIGESTLSAKPIHIGDKVLIGSKSIILKGVTIGKGAIIGAGSVVTKDIPENSLAAGNPAKIIRQNITWN